MADWKWVNSFEGIYMISQYGEVLHIGTGRLTKGYVDRLTGYMKVNLYHHGNNVFLVHRLVAKAFIPNPDDLPHIHHKDGNKRNNRVENLEWVSSKTHGEKMTDDQRTKFRESYQNNLNKRKYFSECH